MWRRIKARCTNIIGQAGMLEGYRITLGARKLFQNATCLPTPPVHLNQDSLCEICACVWYLTLYLDITFLRFPISRVYVHVHIDKIVLGI